MSNTKKVLSLIKENDIAFVDFRFTDPKGKWHHTCYTAKHVDEFLLKEGIMFDGSSIEGWKPINDSDMIIKADCNTAFIDPFTALPTLVIFCDIYEPVTGEGYDLDPRSTARRAEAYLKESKIGDKAFFGPELEFFVFDSARFEVSSHNSMVALDSEEGPYNSGRNYPSGNMGHRPKEKGGYFPVAPVDSLSDLRSEIATVLNEVGLDTILHHHEVAPSQNELGFNFDTLVKTADNVQKYKYVVHNVAHTYGKTATFMPKPILSDNGSGMHVHQSIWNKGKTLFSGDRYAGLSDTALYYIGGIIKHAQALNAFTNASTNSYKRLVPGFEAPVMLAYSERNRSASIRIPHTRTSKGKRVEVRFPDPTANPYYAFSSMLMAGLDGIKNKIDPGHAIDENLYALSEKQAAKIPCVSSSLRQALNALSNDRTFLTESGVFTDTQIDTYIALKMQDVDAWESAPHPIEYQMYYSV